MAFPELTIPKILDTSSHDIIGAFFEPMLQNAKQYDRGVGYFSSGWLRANARGMVAFAENGGAGRWITSPILSEKDWEYLRKGEEARHDEVIREALLRNINDLGEALEQNTLSALAWMIADDIIEFRLALPRDKLQHGEFHDKFGIFKDREGNCVSFNGSYNDSIQGLRNYESLKIFRSWDHTALLVESDIKRFEKLWNKDDPNVRVYDLPEAAREKIIRFRSNERPYSFHNGTLGPGNSIIDTTTHKWRHQDEAIEQFLKKERGVLEMATGTGKTRTALRISKRLLRANEIDSIIVCTYGNDLLDQWYKELLSLRKETPQDLICLRHYSSFRDRDRFSLNPRNKVLLISRSNLAVPLQKLSPEQASRTLLVHDEVHGLGSPANRRDLSGHSDSIRFRLGLSATPEREYDEEGTDFIENHVGPVIFKFELDDAIRRRILAPFNYYPLEYEPDENDRQRLAGVFKQRAARKHEGNPMSQEEVWIELARVHKTSRAKLPVFEAFIEDHQDLLKRCIIFVETIEYGNEVLDIVHRYRYDFHSYFSGEDQRVLERFARGDIECLLTCHRLSEGIDIHSLRNVILFSSARAQLETIQRIGRCLRFDPENPDKVANIVDFIRRPPSDEEGGGRGDNADLERRDFLASLAETTPEE